MLSASKLLCERGERRLFEQLSFTLNPGELLHIKGNNGVGKTSLLRILCGLLSPVTGEVLWQGNNIHAQRERYQSAIAYVGHSDGLKSGLTVFENLQQQSALKNASEARITSALEKIGLLPEQHKLCAVLSQGQRRRLSLARLLLSPCELWILDEPYAALDAAGVRLFSTFLEAHVANKGMVVLTSHQAITLSTIKELRLGECH